MPDANSVSLSMQSALAPAAAFTTVVEELVSALDRLGLRFEPGPDGRVAQGAFVVGAVTEWAPGERVRLEWRAADWRPDATTEVELRVEPVGAGSRVTLEYTAG
ncbi:MAG TPA: SRPBCC domain-containing protein [Ktedonobacterales bacterium]